MAQPISRAELRTYIRTRLGEPVITVNVSNTQIDQRIDDALSLYQDYHYDASERVYIKRQITASNLAMSVASTGTFANGETITGATSNAHGTVVTQANTTFLTFTYANKGETARFAAGETITGSRSAATGTVDTIALGDWDNEYITTNNAVISVLNMVQVGGGVGGERSSGLFSTTFPMIVNDILSLGMGGGELLTYQLTKSHFEMLHDLLVGDPHIRFNRHINRIYVDVNWGLRFRVGDWLVFEAIQLIDPDEYSDIWGDRFIRDYATALVKKQWGSNLIKYTGVPMPGGVQFNAQAIYDEGDKEVRALEESMQSKYELPPGFLVC